VYLFPGWFSRECANDAARRCGFVIPSDDCPTEYKLPVHGSGVIIMDYNNISEERAMLIGSECSAAGSDSVIWINFADHDHKSRVIIEKG
jgi:hypothetical protein